MSKEEDLEFMSIGSSDYKNNSNRNFSYNGLNDETNKTDSVIGSWIFKQSKVIV